MLNVLSNNFFLALVGFRLESIQVDIGLYSGLHKSTVSLFEII